jgi:bidirectional [NiFe] hydrogenase diaphorase subunit
MVLAQTGKPVLPSEDKRWRMVNGTMRRHGYSRDALIETLHMVQQTFGYLDKESLGFVARSLRVPLSQAYGVATFYHFFTLKPPGAHTCLVCMGTACYIKGAAQLLAQAEKALGVRGGETTADREVSLLTARCLGSCSVAPVMVYDGELAGNATGDQMMKQLNTWRACAAAKQVEHIPLREPQPDRPVA